MEQGLTDRIVEILEDRLPAGSELRMADVLAMPLPAGVRAWLGGAIAGRLAESLLPGPHFSHAAGNGGRIARAVVLSLVPQYRIRRDDLRRLLREAVAFTEAFLRRPRSTLEGFLLAGGDRVSVPEIASRLDMITEYRYLGVVLLRLLARRSEVERGELRRLIARVDDEVVRTHGPEELARLMAPLFAWYRVAGMDEVPREAVRDFLDDKAMATLRDYIESAARIRGKSTLSAAEIAGFAGDLVQTETQAQPAMPAEPSNNAEAGPSSSHGLAGGSPSESDPSKSAEASEANPPEGGEASASEGAEASGPSAAEGADEGSRGRVAQGQTVPGQAPEGQEGRAGAGTEAREAAERGAGTFTGEELFPAVRKESLGDTREGRKEEADKSRFILEERKEPVGLSDNREVAGPRGRRRRKGAPAGGKDQESRPAPAEARGASPSESAGEPASDIAEAGPPTAGEAGLPEALSPGSTEGATGQIFEGPRRGAESAQLPGEKALGECSPSGGGSTGDAEPGRDDGARGDDRPCRARSHSLAEAGLSPDGSSPAGRGEAGRSRTGASAGHRAAREASTDGGEFPGEHAAELCAIPDQCRAERRHGSQASARLGLPREPAHGADRQSLQERPRLF